MKVFVLLLIFENQPRMKLHTKENKNSKTIKTETAKYNKVEFKVIY